MLLANATPLTALLADGAWDWFRPSASTTAQEVDNLFWGITYINIFFFVLIVALMVLFVVLYRKRPGYRAEHSPHHNNTLEAVWSLIPLLLVFGIFYYGFTGYLKMRVSPEDAYEINVQAKKWAWAFTYPNGHVDTDLHVPVDRPIRLVLSSADVIHSLYIPAFRVKMDCVPGRYNTMWFKATKPSLPKDELNDNDGEYDTGEGGYDLFCTEYCGTGHSSMMAKVVVYESDDAFAKWMEDATNVRKDPPEVVGERLYKRRGCSQCHSIDGVDRPGNGGPSFKGHYGKMQAFTDGNQYPMDESYIRESILNPQAKIRSGYRPIMPTYQGQFKEDELFAIIAYIKKLNGVGVPDWLPIEGEEQGEGGEAPEVDGAGADGAGADGAGADGPAEGDTAEEGTAEENTTEEDAAEEADASASADG